MLYLIDDSNLKEFDAEFVFDYKNILTTIQTSGQFADISDKLSDANCIMVHRTFWNSTKTKEKCAELSKDGDKIPLVVFSAGDSENAVVNHMSNAVISLKKSVFYSRLKLFLDNYIKSGFINLKLLAYGKDYVKVEVRNLSKDIFSVISGKDGILTLDYLPKIAKCLKKIVTLSSPKIGISYDDLMEKLEDEPITFARFRNNINNIVISFEQYGKNIYTWK